MNLQGRIMHVNTAILTPTTQSPRFPPFLSGSQIKTQTGGGGEQSFVWSSARARAARAKQRPERDGAVF